MSKSFKGLLLSREVMGRELYLRYDSRSNHGENTRSADA
jgi:hypothetical protein